jgi:GT2 family glycosyltransferase
VILPTAQRGVCAVIVTYGNRASLCTQAVHGALESGAGRVVVVDNGSTETAREAISALAAGSHGRVELHSIGQNLGSAGGFGRGIELALRHAECSELWLLDDDTVPGAPALGELLAWRRRLAAELGTSVAVVSYRPARLFQRLVVRGTSVASVYPSRSAVMGFNVADITRKVRNRLLANRPSGRASAQPIQIPYGPYGGLLISRDLVDRVGYPNAELFVYEDDTEYTWRLGAASGGLFLVPTSVVADLEPSWPDRARGRSMFARVLTSDSPGRAFYQVRNRVFFEVEHWMGPAWLHRANRLLYLALLRLSAARLGETPRYRLIVSALHAGERSELGLIPDLKI